LNTHTPTARHLAAFYPAFLRCSVGLRLRASPSDMRKHPTTCEIHCSGDVATNRPSACSIAVGGHALRASDLCKSSARAPFLEVSAEYLSNVFGFAAKSALDQPRCRSSDVLGGAAAGVIEPMSAKSKSVSAGTSNFGASSTQMEAAAWHRMHIGRSFGRSLVPHCAHGSPSQIPTTVRRRS
jgi:hypothetical protein